VEIDSIVQRGAVLPFRRRQRRRKRSEADGTENILVQYGKKRRNAKQAKVATKAQDVAMREAEIYKGLRKWSFAVR
jgi:hypothetical protein